MDPFDNFYKSKEIERPFDILDQHEQGFSVCITHIDNQIKSLEETLTLDDYKLIVKLIFEFCEFDSKAVKIVLRSKYVMKYLNDKLTKSRLKNETNI